MATQTTTATRRRRTTTSRYVTFQYGEGRYTVNPERRKVYSNWVEVETSRAAEILTAYRQARQPEAAIAGASSRGGRGRGGSC